MAPKLYYMAASPPCRAVLMVAKAIGLELELEAVEFEQLRTEEILEVCLTKICFVLIAIGGRRTKELMFPVEMHVI